MLNENGNLLPNNNRETSPTEGKNSWEKMADEAPPFNGSEQATESSDYYTYNGVEYRDVNKIDISTEQGKYDFLDAQIYNRRAKLEHEIAIIDDTEEMSPDEEKNFEENHDDYADRYEDNKYKLDILNREMKILESLDLSGKGGVLGALERARKSSEDILNRAMRNPNGTPKGLEYSRRNWEAAHILAEEIPAEIDIRGSADDGRQIEYTPSAKTQEQIEAEKAAKKRQEDEAFWKRVKEYQEQKRQAERQQETTRKVEEEVQEQEISI